MKQVDTFFDVAVWLAPYLKLSNPDIKLWYWPTLFVVFLRKSPTLGWLTSVTQNRGGQTKWAGGAVGYKHVQNMYNRVNAKETFAYTWHHSRWWCAQWQAFETITRYSSFCCGQVLHVTKKAVKFEWDFKPSDRASEWIMIAPKKGGGLLEDKNDN